ncbi:uncharacterized protein LOC144110399 isoform X2 [Amblyomma americanum]
MHSTLLFLCVILALIATANSQPKRGRPRRIRLPSVVPRKPYCPHWCDVGSRVGVHCGPDCKCVEPAPGAPPRPLPCIWSPAMEHIRNQRGRKRQARLRMAINQGL